MSYQPSDCARNDTRANELSGLLLFCLHGSMSREIFGNFCNICDGAEEVQQQSRS